MTLEELTEVTIDMAEQVFEISYSIKPEWAN